MGKGETQLSDREEEKGEEIEGTEQGKNRVRQEEKRKEGGKDGESDREGEKGTSGAGKEKGKGAEMQEERRQEREDEVLGELQREVVCLSPMALPPHSQLLWPPQLRWPWLTGWRQRTARQGRSHRKGEEKQLLLGFCERYCFVAGTKHSTFQ